nr:hypothetical protein Itr_chr06CG17410 [Ipomoea trifida]
MNTGGGGSTTQQHGRGSSTTNKHPVTPWSLAVARGCGGMDVRRAAWRKREAVLTVPLEGVATLLSVFPLRQAECGE